MAKARGYQRTEVELPILRILWDLDPSPVRKIHARLSAEQGTNPSTTVKMLSVMLAKDLARRDEQASPPIYRPKLTREAAGKRWLSDSIEMVYDGAAMSPALQTLSSVPATRERLDEVRRRLDQFEGKQS